MISNVSVIDGVVIELAASPNSPSPRGIGINPCTIPEYLYMDTW